MLTWFLKNWEKTTAIECKKISSKKNLSKKKPRGISLTNSDEPQDTVNITCTKTPLAYCWYLYATETASTQPHFLDISFLLSKYISGEMYVEGLGEGEGEEARVGSNRGEGREE